MILFKGQDEKEENMIRVSPKSCESRRRTSHEGAAAELEERGRGRVPSAAAAAGPRKCARRG